MTSAEPVCMWCETPLDDGDAEPRYHALCALSMAVTQLRFAAERMRALDDVVLLVGGREAYSVRGRLFHPAHGCDLRADEIQAVLDRELAKAAAESEA